MPNIPKRKRNKRNSDISQKGKESSHRNTEKVDIYKKVTTMQWQKKHAKRSKHQ